MLRKLIFTAFLISVISSNLYSQETVVKEKTVVEEEKTVRYDYKWGFFEKPSIEVSYGLANIDRKDLAFGLSDVGMLEMKLGFTSQRKSAYGSNVLKYKNNFSYLSYFSSNLSSVNENAGMTSEMFRFGAGKKDGLGVKLGTASIMPYTATTVAWSRLKLAGSDIGTDPGEVSLSGKETLVDFNESFRFGTTAESGINLNVTNGISLQAKYERSLIFPRHLFAKWAGSKIVEEAGLALLDGFTSEVLDNQPVAGTLVNFLLKSGYLWGINELRVTDMNWPFGGEAPLKYDTFKFGMTFTF